MESNSPSQGVFSKIPPDLVVVKSQANKNLQSPMTSWKISALISILSISAFLEPGEPPPSKSPQSAVFFLQATPKECPPGGGYSFFPSFPETGLVTFSNKADRPTLTLIRLKKKQGKFSWKQLLLGNLPPLTETKGLLLGRTPFLGESPNYGLVFAQPSDSPKFIDKAPFLQTSAIEKAPALGIPILSTDLDRDGFPELWAMNPDRENEEASPAFLFSAPLAEDASSSPIPDLPLGGGFAGVLVFDFDQDYLEDFLLFGSGKKISMVLNKGNLSWSLAQESALPQGKMGDPLQAKKLFLSPSFLGKQWLLALTQENKPLLLERREGKVFKPSARDLGAIGDDIRDARFLDQNLDGNPELWVLTNTGIFRVELAAPGVDLLLRIQGGQRVLIGDLNGDLAPDFCILRKKKSPLILLNKPHPAALSRSLSVSLVGIEEFPHAIGAYVELLIGEKVVQRHRWPPQRTDDALALFFSLPDPLTETASFRVTWPDGNISESEVKPGTHSRLKH
jgi:hypothetical protein